MGSVLEILVLRALALEVYGDQTSAFSTLERALLLAEPEVYIRSSSTRVYRCGN